MIDVRLKVCEDMGVEGDGGGSVLEGTSCLLKPSCSPSRIGCMTPAQFESIETGSSWI
jgi:hypothetical protein